MEHKTYLIFKLDYVFHVMCFMFHDMYFITLSLLGILAILQNYLNTSLFISLPVGLGFLVVASYVFGKILFKNLLRLEQFILGLFAFLLVVIILGTGLFYGYGLDNWFFVLMTLGLVGFCWFFKEGAVNEHTPPAPPARGGSAHYASLISETQNTHQTFSNKDKNTSFSISSLNTTYDAFSLDSPPRRGGWGGAVLGRHKQLKNLLNKFSSIILLTIFLITIATLFYILFTYATTTAIRTPWEVVPKYFFAGFFVASLSLIVLIIKGVRPLAKGSDPLVLVSIYTFLIYSIVLIIYKIGYGFDPFIHRATLKVIWETGTITPKPFYYIGKYSLIFYLAKLTGLSINFLDKILVPALSTIFLPAIIFNYLSKLKNNYQINWLILLSLLAIPLDFFILTTPQNLANLFFIVLLILSLSCKPTEPPNPAPSTKPLATYDPCQGGYVPRFLLILNAIAIFCIHPLTGIPAILFVVVLLLWQFYLQKKQVAIRYLLGIIILLGAISLPAVLLINSYFSADAGVSITNHLFINIKNFFHELIFINFKYQWHYKAVLSMVYMFWFNLSIILITIFSVGLWRIYREKKLTTYAPFLILSIIFWSNYFLLKLALDFNFLISYEKENYADRVLLISLFFLLPLLMEFLIWLWEKFLTADILLKSFMLLMLASSLTAGLYLHYPRHDNFVASSGLSMSNSSIKAVNYINQHSQNDFIVLTDQQTSATALQEFGFKKYYHTSAGEIFYYPIPTGKPLYQYYLKMVNEKPTRETMNEAMDFVGVKESYFVINKYWWNSKQIIETAKAIADEYESVDDGEVYVFKFLK